MYKFYTTPINTTFLFKLRRVAVQKELLDSYNQQPKNKKTKKNKKRYDNLTHPYKNCCAPNAATRQGINYYATRHHTPWSLCFSFCVSCFIIIFIAGWRLVCVSDGPLHVTTLSSYLTFGNINPPFVFKLIGASSSSILVFEYTMATKIENRIFIKYKMYVPLNRTQNFCQGNV